LRYWLYIIECADGTYYTGIASDVARRLSEHNGGNSPGARGKGARYTSARRPVTLVFAAPFANRSDALRQEARVKGLTRRQKQQMIDAARRYPQPCASEA
jgi:predicted GIY-YIG superfamily endonuclease